MDVQKALLKRTSTRAYLERPVSKDSVYSILDAAKQAPSGSNTQPWQVMVVTGGTKQKISDALIAARKNNEPEHPDYLYYPSVWESPLKERRFECGVALYNALGIKREEHEKRVLQWNANYQFFGAPVGLLFFLDAKLNQGSWVDVGMFIQSVMLAALDHGLATCPQASIAEYPDIIRKLLLLDKNQLLVCGMSLGYPDGSHPVNQYRTSRVKPEDFTHWYD